MKSPNYTPQLVKIISLFLLLCPISGRACGPYYETISSVDFFGGLNRYMSDFDKEENLLLWQHLTSPDIPLSDIEQAVYFDDSETFLRKSENKKTKNRFYNFLRDANQSDIKDFLLYAKQVEKSRETTRSPWFYPRQKGASCVQLDVEDNEWNYRYGTASSSRLADRYALMLTRVYFSNRQYDRCIEFVDTAFARFPDSNLMKRMAKRYAAGCWRRLGDTPTSDSIFASTGDIWSLTVNDPVANMIDRNPNAPTIMAYIHQHHNDTTFMLNALDAAKLLPNNVANRGDWEFFKAYCENEFGGNSRKASRLITKALTHNFSLPEVKEMARYYRMKLDAINGNMTNLLTDLKWALELSEQHSWTANHPGAMLQNIIYTHWVPNLWQKKQYATAILLCSFVDHLDSGDCSYLSDQGMLSFQLMGSLSSKQLEKVYGQVKGGGPLFKLLRRFARTDADYYNELIGTLAIREERYDRAIRFLSKVSDEYQRSLGIFKEGSLNREPFLPYPSRWHTYSWDDETSYEYEQQISPMTYIPGTLNAKLNFAKQMLNYQREMKTAKRADDRLWARLMYAIGRVNSWEECWALTQYWRGDSATKFYPSLQYWDSNQEENQYSFIFDYETSTGHKSVEEAYQRELATIRQLITSDATRARMEYLFGNLKTVIRRYPDTPTAAFVRQSCDNWRNWL